VALKLDKGVQQDAQEFHKLFLSHVEERFQSSDAPEVKNLVRGHFQGTFSYVTTCKNCGTTSRKLTSFTELELSIEKHATVEEALRAFVAEEELTGDNKYSCDTCDSLQDATRRIEIERLPPVLNLQLLRFQFDMGTLDKKKVHTTVSFPLALDMSAFVKPEAGAAAAPVPAPTMEYELFVVLVHRGNSANGGHFVCHASPEGSGKWFEFDDTAVSEIVLDKVGAAGGEEKGKGKKKGATAAEPARPRSTGAYMLMYRRKGKRVAETHPPPELEKEVSVANDALLEFVAQSEAQKKELGEKWAQRK
jgi:ubiquitin carboxyl-terminal hydrolase 48